MSDTKMYQIIQKKKQEIVDHIMGLKLFLRMIDCSSVPDINKLHNYCFHRKIIKVAAFNTDHYPSENITNNLLSRKHKI